jgi:hypothetical protein
MIELDEDFVLKQVMADKIDGQPFIEPVELIKHTIKVVRANIKETI